MSGGREVEPCATIWLNRGVHLHLRSGVACCVCWEADSGTATVIGGAVTERDNRQALLARWVGIVSAAWPVICSCSGSTDGGRTYAYRHSTGYGRTPINATTITPADDATVINASATNANASSICEGVS